MTHVFISPHPDDAALSCGGLITSLRELGQSVTIVTVYSGTAGETDAVDYERRASGFGTKPHWPATQTFDRSNIASEYPVSTDAAAVPPWLADAERTALTQERANTQTRQFWQRAAWTRSANITNEAMEGRPLRDEIATQGVLPSYDFADGDPVEKRRAEDERYAYFAEAALVDLDLPDAVHRGYEGDDALLGMPDPDDEPPAEMLRREILRLEPQQVYFPLGVGGHVDHRLCRDAGLVLLEDGRSWVMPSPDMALHTSFYEDFPYAWWNGFDNLGDLAEQDVQLPEGLSLEARYSDISDQLARKSAGLRIYGDEMRRLFDDDQSMLDAVAGYAARVAQAGAVHSSAAERYWSVTPS